MVAGLWGKKVGMTQVFSKENAAIPVTVINTAGWFVTNIRTKERDGYTAVQIGRIKDRYAKDSFETNWLKLPKKYFSIFKEVKVKDETALPAIGLPANEASILTVDGIGEWTSTSVGYAKNNEIKLTNDIRWPHSLGLFYSAFTYYLGFKVNEGEYKLMGLSSYGEPKYYDLIKKELIDIKNDGSIHLNMKYFSYTYDKVMINNKFAELFNCPVKKEDSEIRQIHFDIGASAQLVLEEVLLKMINHIYKK